MEQFRSSDCQKMKKSRTGPHLNAANFKTDAHSHVATLGRERHRLQAVHAMLAVRKQEEGLPKPSSRTSEHKATFQV